MVQFDPDLVKISLEKCVLTGVLSKEKSDLVRKHLNNRTGRRPKVKRIGRIGDCPYSFCKHFYMFKNNQYCGNPEVVRRELRGGRK